MKTMFGEALSARTGKRSWHLVLTHHDEDIVVAIGRLEAADDRQARNAPCVAELLSMMTPFCCTSSSRMPRRARSR